MRYHLKTNFVYGLVIAVFLLGLLGLTADRSFAQTSSQSNLMKLPFGWPVGAKAEYDYIFEVQKFTKKKKTMKVRYETSVQIEVLEKNAQGFRLRWSYGDVAFKSEPNNVNSVVDRLNAELLRDLEFVLLTDEAGSPIGIENKEPLLAQIDKALAAIGTYLDRQRLSTSVSNQIKNLARQVANPQSVDQLLIKPPTLLLWLSGLELGVGEEFAYEAPMPNVYGGEPFPSKGSVTVIEMSSENNSAQIETLQEIDPAAVPAILEESLRKLAQAGNQALPDKLPKLETKDIGRYEYDTQTGWARDVEFVRQSVTGDHGRQESYLFTARSAQ